MHPQRQPGPISARISGRSAGNSPVNTLLLPKIQSQEPVVGPPQCSVSTAGPWKNYKKFVLVWNYLIYSIEQSILFAPEFNQILVFKVRQKMVSYNVEPSGPSRTLKELGNKLTRKLELQNM